MNITGHCLCGEIEFEISGDLPNFYQCHCSLCRNQSGSTSNTATVVERSRLKWKKGETLIRSYRKPSGFTSNFCSQCGSPVPNTIKGTELYWIPIGLIDSELTGSIAVHLHTESKAHWDTQTLGGKCYKDMPSLTVLLEELHNKK